MDELTKLKKKANKIINKADEIGYAFSDLDLGAISSIGRTEKGDNLNFLAIQHLERLYNRLFKTK